MNCGTGKIISQSDLEILGGTKMLQYCFTTPLFPLGELKGGLSLSALLQTVELFCII